MSRNLAEVMQAAQDAALVPSEQFQPLSIFPKNYEPEAKIDLNQKISKLIAIRKKLADPNNPLGTAVVPDSINMGGQAMVNIIVEPSDNEYYTPLFMHHRKFMRIAGRVDDNGNLYDRKIALKCLSSSVILKNGIPFRQEFEPKLPKGMTLEQEFDWFLREYEKEYNNYSFSHLTLQDMHPTSGYMSARTGFNFTRKSPKMALTFINEACEDLYMPIGADLMTNLADPQNPEAQFEWETVGALATPEIHISVTEREKIELGLRSMRKVLRNLIQEVHGQNCDWESFCTTDSKAEVSRERTLAHPSFMWPYTVQQQFENAGITPKISAYRYVLENRSAPIVDILAKADVKNALCRFARTMERTRLNYNRGLEGTLAFNPARTLTA